MTTRRLVLTTTLLASLALSSIQPVYSASPSPSPQASPNSTTGSLVPPTQPTTGIDLSLSPTFLNLVTDPGVPVAGELKIKNNNNFMEYLQMDIAKFEAAQGGARPLISNIGPNDDFAKWVSFDPKQFTVDANQTKTVKFTINPPKEASLGYYYAFLVNRIQEQKPEGQQTVVAGSPAFLTLLEVRSPNAKRDLKVESFTTDQAFYEYLPANFEIKVKNDGNIHVVPTGDIFIDRGDKKTITVLHANEGRSNILPQTERTFTTSWDDGLITRVPKEENGKVVKDSKGNVVYTTKFDFNKPLSKFRFGKYTANLLMVYDNGERDVPLVASVSFWVIPWKLMLLALLIILSPFLLFLAINRLRRRR